MKLYDRFGAKGFHSSFITTFGIDFDAYENICLNRLRGAGCMNNFVLPDARMLSLALDGASALPRYAGRLYAPSGMDAAQGGVFHSKLFLRLGRRTGELMIGSANMTAPGLAGNRELMGLISCNLEESGERRIIAAAWSYIEGLIDKSQRSVAQQISWMLARTPWLHSTEPADGLVSLRDGSAAAFLTNGETSIGRQFTDFIDDGPIKRLIVISPYWDSKLTALKALIAELKPKQTMLLIEPDRRLFPVAALKTMPYIALRDISTLDAARFFHAKAIIAQTSKADHVLFGSANCTVAALGTKASAGINEEACLYRRLPPKAAIAALGIGDLLARENALKSEDIKPPQIEDDLKLAELANRNAGRFECFHGILTWWPPDHGREGAIELFDASGEPLAVALTPLPAEASETRRFRLEEDTERPALARLLYPDGKVSALAIVALADLLQENAREARGKKAEGAAALLSEETNEGFWLLEVLDTLEDAERSQQAEGARTITRRRRTERPDPPEDDRKLDYAAFIAGRQVRPSCGAGASNSFGGSDLSLVRGFLNRILGIEKEQSREADSDDDIGDAFDLGDETGNPGDAIEGGEDFATPKPKAPEDDDEEKKKEELRKKRRKANEKQIIDAVELFSERIKQRVEDGALCAIDVLRLRALIVVIAGAGWDGTKEAAKTLSTMQVLRPTGYESWGRLLGRVISTFFGGNDPAIAHLRIDASFDELTADIKECWASCYWAIQVGLDAARKHGESAQFVKLMEALSQRLYAVTRLHESELGGPEITAIIDRMNERYSERLGFDPAAIDKSHRREIAGLAAAVAAK